MVGCLVSFLMSHLKCHLGRPSLTAVCNHSVPHYLLCSTFSPRLFSASPLECKTRADRDPVKLGLQQPAETIWVLRQAKGLTRFLAVIGRARSILGLKRKDKLSQSSWRHLRDSEVGCCALWSSKPAVPRT